jgi:hypothetical protein
MTSHQYGKPKKKKRNILLETDVDAADAVTFEDVTTISKGGRATTKRVKVALYPQEEIPQIPDAGPSSEPLDAFANNMDMGEPVFDEAPFAAPPRRKVRSRGRSCPASSLNSILDAEGLHIGVCGQYRALFGSSAQPGSIADRTVQMFPLHWGFLGNLEMPRLCFSYPDMSQMHAEDSSAQSLS